MRPNQARLQADRLDRDADARSYAAELVRALKEPHTVLVTGATGFIGSRLAQALAAAGHDLIVLTRNPAKAADLSPPFRLITDLDQLPSATRIDAIVNLAGEPLGDGIWTRGKRRRIMASRLRITAKLVRLIARLKLPPKVLISASAISWYGRWQDEVLTEFDGGKRSFTHRVCEAWEQTARRAQRHGVRVVRLRIGQVLGTQGGLLRTGVGAVPLTGPLSSAVTMQWAMRRTRSSRSIQDSHCVPEPIAPPRPSRNGRSRPRNRPPCVPST